MDNRPITDITVAELEKIVTKIPKEYFDAACKSAREQCQKAWAKDINEMGEKITGLDVSTVMAKDHIRGVYKHAEGLQEKSHTFRATVFVEMIKWACIAIAIFLGIKK